MPPSPALRCSPGRELRASNHKRGHSFESGLLSREKVDDLALFDEMQARERENFLLHSSDDFEDSFSTKLRHFSDLKLGIIIPVRGESSALLNVDGEKNDYDWLLTPPDTPLFPSLDDEPPPVTTACRGRPRSQPISISRSSTMEKSHRSSRGSASPSRLSPSPRSANSGPLSRGRPFAAPHSSPTPSVRHATPTRRPSPPPSKPSTSVPRSSTPTPRRMSTGSNSTGSASGMRGTSPIKTVRGNSASPKISAWQTSIPGLSSEAPPNLRTSLADRPASYVRGSSPASRNGRDSASKISRQSMSPTGSRSASSSHSHDRDRLSSYSRGSVASSGDDDVDSLQSVPLGTLDHSSTKRPGSFSNNKALAFSKKSARTLSSTSAPKRSFDYTVRQMDQRKSPQNMFRPLLSSVPSTTLYAGMSSGHRSLISRNSSVTTSSNASSDQYTSIAPDNEGSGHNQDDTSEYVKLPFTDIHEEMFAFDKMDVVDEDSRHEAHNESLNIQHDDTDRSTGTRCCPVDFEDSGRHISLFETNPTSEASYIKDDSLEVGNLEKMVLCSRCGCRYHVIELLEMDVNLCPECSREEKLLDATIDKKMTTIAESSSLSSSRVFEANIPPDEMQSLVVVRELPLVTDVDEPRVSESVETVEQDKMFFDQRQVGNCLEIGQPIVGQSLPDTETEYQQLVHRGDLKFEIPDGAGISILLKRSSSGKGPVIQGRTFTATAIPYDDLSYTRDSASSLRSSVGHSSFSASSSTDFSSSRHIETRVQRQLSGRKSEMENLKYEINMKPQSSAHQLSSLSTKTQEANLEVSDKENITIRETDINSQKSLVPSEYAESDVTNTSSTRMLIVDEDKFESSNCGVTDASSSEFSREAMQLDENLVKSFPSNEYCASYENKEDLLSNRSASDVEASIVTPESSLEDERNMVDNGVYAEDVRGVHAHSLSTISEIEVEKKLESFPVPQTEDVSMISNDTLEENQESSDPTHSGRDWTSATVQETDTCDGFLEESTVMVECQGGRSKGRSLTLEEATDAILFCSSIVHDLAYSAATIAMEKETPVALEGSRPMVTILGKSNTDRKEPHIRTVGKRALKSQKPRQRRIETDAKPPSCKTENDENADESSIRNVGLPNKVDSMKPPKLESKCNCSIM